MPPRDILLGFEGRLPRLALLGWGLPVFAGALLVYLGIEHALSRMMTPPRSEGVAGLAVLALGFVPFAPLLVKRLHDVGRGGWWLLALAAPEIANSAALAFGLGDTRPGRVIEYVSFAGGAGLAILALWPGTPGANRFGPAPARPADQRA